MHERSRGSGDPTVDTHDAAGARTRRWRRRRSPVVRPGVRDPGHVARSRLTRLRDASDVRKLLPVGPSVAVPVERDGTRPHEGPPSTWQHASLDVAAEHVSCTELAVSATTPRIDMAGGECAFRSVRHRPGPESALTGPTTTTVTSRLERAHSFIARFPLTWRSSDPCSLSSFVRHGPSLDNRTRTNWPANGRPIPVETINRGTLRPAAADQVTLDRQSIAS